VAVTCHAKFEVAEPIHCRIIAFLLMIHYIVLYVKTVLLFSKAYFNWT